MPRPSKNSPKQILSSKSVPIASPADPLWFKDAIIYQLHVRSFRDSTGDGIGDFRGLHDKLGYFEDMGVNSLWLMPFYPSPMRDDGYDIADYFSVHPVYGTLKDFQDFLAEAHRRKLRVITELVINHTSDQHGWFQRARKAPSGTPEREFYVWSDSPRRFEEARILFKDFETSNWAWDPAAGAYYWHRFYSHQPDLNFDNPLVREAVLSVVEFWLRLGVDGIRLDAVPYLFERDGTSCENLPETHAFLRELREHLDKKFPERILLAETNLWPEEAASYFGQADECHLAFHFPLMARLFMALQMEDRFPIIDILEQTPEIPPTCQWAIFLRNHDELTLEMVTDEERDYMYRLFAEDPRARLNRGIRRRLAPLLNNNRRRIELINALLLSMPGTPIIYYGDEIGMGDNIYLGDRKGVRTPMQWSADRNAGFSKTNPQRLFLPVIVDPEFHFEAVNVDVQLKNVSSLFWWMRRIIAVRRRLPALSHGTIEFLHPTNAKVLAFLRQYKGETVLVVANLSRFSQSVTIDLSRFQGHQAEELFGGGPFVEITDTPIFFTIGPNDFYWLLLTKAVALPPPAPESLIRTLETPSVWSDELLEVLRTTVLPEYLPLCRWFGQKQRTLRSIEILEARAEQKSDAMRVMLLKLSFADGDPVTQVMPLFIGKEDEGEPKGVPAMVARFADGMILWDALYVGACRKKVWEVLAARDAWQGSGVRQFGIKNNLTAEIRPSKTRLLGGEQSNSTLSFDDAFLLKFLRKFEPGPHPDADIIRALGNNNFPNVPRYAGEIRCRVDREEGVLALLTTYVKNQGECWTYALDGIARFFERVLSTTVEPDEEEPELTELAGAEFPPRLRQLGVRTAELHRCLESIDSPDFSPEPFTLLYQRSLYQTMRSLLRRTEREVTNKLPDLPPEIRAQALEWFSRTPRILAAYSVLLKRKITATKTRVHGDYHLGQVLNTGNDFIILDFEGEPRKTLGERLLKRSPLVDVAGMVRSFDYAVEVSLLQQKPQDQDRLQPWALRWLELVTTEFLEGYQTTAAGASFLPPTAGEFDALLKLFALDKAVYEIGYELNYRPDFLRIPLSAVNRLVEGGELAIHHHPEPA
jgi:maltose alpha-D-glucosyltransferase/alpha-amylase